MQMDKLFNIHLRHCHCRFVLHKKGQNGYFGPVMWIQTTAKKTSHLLIWQITFCLEQSFFPPSPPAESELDVCLFFYVYSNRHFSISLKKMRINVNIRRKAAEKHVCSKEDFFFLLGGPLVTEPETQRQTEQWGHTQWGMIWRSAKKGTFFHNRFLLLYLDYFPLNNLPH